MIPTQNKYMVVGNGRVPTYSALQSLPNKNVDHISVELPDWFRNYNGRKYIKVYGTQVYFLRLQSGDDDDKYTFDQIVPLEATLHSDIAKDTNTGIIVDPLPNLPAAPGPDETAIWGKKSWWETGPFSGTINDIYDQYILTVNNFYTPKLYEYTDPTIQEIRFWFKNRYGVRMPIFYLIKNDANDLLSAMLLFKIEMELITE
jgi:hypothetical protein